MSNFTEWELEALKFFLQEHTGFNFPGGLETEFNFRLKRALNRWGYNLNYLLAQLYQQSDSYMVVKTLSPLLPELLIGETYLWREPDSFEAIASQVLPEITSRKSPFSQLLRVWSAACSTGEEVYSMAILLKHYFKNSGWSWSVMGSDLNEKALEIARQGEYGEYSFRTPDRKYSHCFEPGTQSSQWRVKDEYRTAVHFQKINLAANEYPSPGNYTCNYDLILCRNVFIYFTVELSEQIINRLYESLNDGGYLVVSPCEYSQQLFKRFETIQTGTVTLYRRPLRFWVLPELPDSDFKAPSTGSTSEPGPVSTPTLSVVTRATRVATEAQHRKIASPLKAEVDLSATGQIELAKAALSSSCYQEAIRCCQEAIKADSLLADSYLMLAWLYQQEEQLEMALEMARKFAYLEPARPEGQYYLATLQQGLGRPHRAIPAYKKLVELLGQYNPGARLESLPNLTSNHLRQLAIENLLLLETTHKT